MSGAEARGEPATTDRPYRETARYDAFNHLNVRSSQHWSRSPEFSSTDTYSDNRRVGWTYDADGNWLSGAGRQHAYDAAGRSTSTTWTSGYFNEFYDGDGQRVKATGANVVTYYLRSSVLGGQVVEELNGSGGKQQAFIYIGQKVIGHDWANGNVSLLHEDPSGVMVRSSLPQSAFVTYFAELDPWGAEVFSDNPYVEDPGFTGGRGESAPTYSGYGDISLPSTGCMLDGDYTLCEFLRNEDSLALQLTKRGKTKQFPLEPGLLGILAVWMEDAGQRLTKPQTPVGAEVSAGDVIVTNTESDGLGHWEPIELVRQNTATGQDIQPRRLLANIFHLLDDNRCSTFVSNLINTARQLTGKKPYTYDGKELAVAVARQENGGFIFRSGANGGGGGGSAYGDIFSGQATVEIIRFNTANDGPRDYQGSYALAALHELIHLAGGGASVHDGSRAHYNDIILARAANILTGAPGYPGAYDPNMPPSQITAEMTNAAGTYWNNQLKEYCLPQGWRPRAK